MPYDISLGLHSVPPIVDVIDGRNKDRNKYWCQLSANVFNVSQGADPKWVNLNAKLYPNAFTSGERYNHERNVVMTGRTNTAFWFVFTEGTGGWSGSGSESSPFVVPGFYDGTKLYLSVSANNEIPEAGGGLKETGFTALNTYTVPRIGVEVAKEVVGRNNPLEYAGIYGGSIDIKGLNPPVYTSYERFELLFDSNKYKETSTNSYTYQTNAYKSTSNTSLGNINTSTFKDMYSKEEYISVDGLSKVVRSFTVGTYTHNFTSEASIRTMVPESDDGSLNQIIYKVNSYDRYGSYLYTSNRNYVKIPLNSDYNKGVQIVHLVVFYRPRLAVNQNTVQFRMNSSSGNTISKGSTVTYFDGNNTILNDVNVKWSYYDAKTTPRAGVVSGYKIYVYDKNTTDAQPVYTYDTKSNIDNANIPIKDLPKLRDLYISIVPYYKTTTGAIWEQNAQTNIKIPFVSLVSELRKPEIEYPTQNSNWINNEFRVCFKLPEDLDQPWVEDTYTYENIELDINGNIIRINDSQATSTNSTLLQEAFSSLYTNLTYQKGIVVYPNVNNTLSSTTSYSIRLRVKKRYGTTTTSPRWSQWSDYRKFKITKINYDVNPGDLIMATHFNNALNDVDRSRKTYGVVWNNKQPNAIANSTKIEAQQYSYPNMFQKINETKLQVNNYTTFDTGRENLKFDTANKILTSFNEQVGELITAEKETEINVYGNLVPGRNYIRIVEETCDYLL